MSLPELKICGLRCPEQALAIAALGVEAIGVIGVPSSPRYLAAEPRQKLFAALEARFPSCQRVLVVADPRDEELPLLEGSRGHTVVQLHGMERPERCAELRRRLGVRIWKALRIRSPEDLGSATPYQGVADALLLDAWAADQLGGTGRRLPLDWLDDFAPSLPWWLAGGITPEGLRTVLGRLRPDGLDVSSGVEESPGVKNLSRVEDLIRALRESGEIPAA